MTLNTSKIKNSSIEMLARMGIAAPASLPVIESLSDLEPQSSKSCAKRVTVLGYMICFGFGAKSDDLKGALEKYSLWDSCSELEKGHFGRDLSDQEKVNCTWLTECVQSFAWAFGLAELNHFQRCDDDLASNFPDPFSDPSDFIANATLRPLGELMQMADMHYRMHWASRDARLMGREFPLQEGVISERRKALDWIIGVEGNWDEVPANT